jgi:hypothetical protein
LLVGDKATVLDVTLCLTDGGKKGNLVRNIAVIYVVRKPVDRLKNLFFNAHVSFHVVERLLQKLEISWIAEFLPGLVDRALPRDSLKG